MGSAVHAKSTVGSEGVNAGRETREPRYDVIVDVRIDGPLSS
jgi:hypothetical protein